MTVATPMKVPDQTMAHKWQMPAPEAQRWAAFGVPDPLQVETDQAARQPPGPESVGSESVGREQTALDHEEDRPSVKRAHASTGEQASSAPAIGDAPRYATRSQLDPEAVLILRAKYLGAVLDSLENMHPHAKTPRVARYAGELLDASTIYADRVPDDPVVEVVLAVYPSLADENHWADWSAEQLRDLHGILRGLAKLSSVTPKMVDKAITKIEEQVGLDTLPFEIDPRWIN